MSPDERLSRADESDLRTLMAALTERVQILERDIARLARSEPTGTVAAPPPPPAPVFSAPSFPSAEPLPTHPLAPHIPVQQQPRASLEKRLGSQVFNRVGIVALLIGCAWFLKLAIDNRWIGPVGRILVGLVAGSAVVVWSERFRRRGYASFSYSLKAIGTGVLYLSLWAAFQLYHLLPAPAALVAMLLIAAWNAYMAWSQHAELLAAYALMGAMITPALLSTGGNHEVFLFTYLFGIDLATVVLVRLKHWPRLLLGAFPATVAYFIDWFGSFYTASELALTTVFAALLAAVFVFPSLGESEDDVADWRESLRQLLLPLANAAFLAFALYSILDNAGHHATVAWTMLALAAVYLIILRLPQTRVTAGVHLSIAVVLLSVAIPLKANGRWITVGWLVEGLALLLLAYQSSMAAESSGSPSFTRLLELLSYGALALGWAGALVQLYSGIYFSQAFLNPRFATALTGVAVLAAASLIARKFSPFQAHPNRRAAVLHTAAVLNIGTNLLAVLAGVQEIQALWQHAPADAEAQLQKALAVSAFLMLYGAALLTAGFLIRSAFLRWQALALLVFTILKTFLYDMRNLSQGYRVVSFLALGVLLMAVSFAYQKDWLSLRETETAP